jgi:hypothetical protein
VSVGKRAYNVLRGYVNREWERIKDLDRLYAEQELDDAMDLPAPARTVEPSQPPVAVDRKERARQLLGVGPEATFNEIRKAFERLNKRSDPAKFPAGSSAATQADDIQKRVNWAYQVLTENVDVTEKRFKSLEIE